MLSKWDFTHIRGADRSVTNVVTLLSARGERQSLLTLTARVRILVVTACGTWDFFSCFNSLILVRKVGSNCLVFSDMDEKFRRSRVHVVHVKDPSAVENRERVGDYAAVLAKFKIEKPSQVEKEKKNGSVNSHRVPLWLLTRRQKPQSSSVTIDTASITTE